MLTRVCLTNARTGLTDDLSALFKLVAAGGASSVGLLKLLVRAVVARKRNRLL